MASSRWKRFAFFERHALNLSTDVLEDIFPVGSDVDGSRRSLRTQQTAGEEAGDDSISLVATTAALPLTSKPTATNADSRENAMEAMWSSLTACTSPVVPQDGDGQEDTVQSIRLPSQGFALSSDQNALASSSNAFDGLVLVFISSRFTELIHCVDLTMRCNPPAAATGKDIDDMDGWRGYFCPFAKPERRTIQEANIDHTEDSTSEKIIALATCRETSQHNAVLLACISKRKVCVWEDPHLYLSCSRPLASSKIPQEARVSVLQNAWNPSDGDCLSVDIVPGLVAVGSTSGYVIVYAHTPSRRTLRTFIRIPPPPSGHTEAVSVKLSVGDSGEANNKAIVFVAYRRTGESSNQASTGICCYELPVPNQSNANSISAPSARHDLDGRSVAAASLVDAFPTSKGLRFTVARLDGLYSYSRTERTGIAPIDGIKLVMSIIPPCTHAQSIREMASDQIGSGYALVASTDAKSGRDAVDVYDCDNKLVAFHLLLSPGHSAVRSAGITTRQTLCTDGSVRHGRSSAIVLTSGGSLVTLTEKLTAEKISLLVQKNLYPAAIVVAYADASCEPDEITNLYRQYAEHLYRKGDFGGAIDQYINTIGSLESSHVLYRYLDAPKIPHLVRYLEQLRTRGVATPVHNELLRTCYLKLNDTDAAAALEASGSRSIDKGSLASIFSKISSQPKDALAAVCSLDARQAAEVLVVHGASLARVLPRETAGVVISLCVGTYSPKSLAEAAMVDAQGLKKMIERKVGDDELLSKPYPVHLFASAFIEHPKMLRLILSHCNRNKCLLTPSLRRTLLELTLAEWNQAKRSGDTEAEKLRHKEAIAALTDSHCKEIGDYDALVIVQQAGFEEGEMLLYERLLMTPMLLERYAKDGSEKSRRQMLAMCKTDPEVLADVLGHLVAIASGKARDASSTGGLDDDSQNDELNEIMEDIQEALSLARRQGVLPPVRIARILAGESFGQFSSDVTHNDINKGSIPLSVAVDYVGSILEESRKEITRLTTEVEEYNAICNSMEKEIEDLLRVSNNQIPLTDATAYPLSRLNIDDIYLKVRADENDSSKKKVDKPTEAFWRDMNQSEDSFEVIARYFAKGIIT